VHRELRRCRLHDEGVRAAGLEPKRTAFVAPAGIDINRLLIVQVSRFDPWKDHGPGLRAATPVFAIDNLR
jgi:hypothetical protein